MRAVVCRDFSQPLQLEEVDDPKPLAEQVVIDVNAAGVTFVDGLISAGKYQIRPELPYIPGFEVSGLVREVGSKVVDLRPGDRVFATPGLAGGGYAERVAVGRSEVFSIPDGLSFGQAATFVQSYCTALFSLTQRMRLGQGQTLLVLGASGGVGRAAIDVGKALGARVIAAASSSERLRSCADLEPDGVIDYSTQDLKDEARRLSDGGVDAVFDPVGGDLSEMALRALGHDGTFLVVGFALGAIPRLPANQILLRNRRVVGVEWGGWRALYPDSQQAMVNELLDWVSTGRLKPVEPKAYPLSEVVDVLGSANGRQMIGKAVLVP